MPNLGPLLLYANNFDLSVEVVYYSVQFNVRMSELSKVVQAVAHTMSEICWAVTGRTNATHAMINAEARILMRAVKINERRGGERVT